MSKYVRSVILIGKDAGLLVRDLIDITPIAQTSTLELAVSLAKAQASSGDVVLLSPACASLDMFRDFNHRGDVFIKAVHAL